MRCNAEGCGCRRVPQLIARGHVRLTRQTAPLILPLSRSAALLASRLATGASASSSTGGRSRHHQPRTQCHAAQFYFYECEIVMALFARRFCYTNADGVKDRNWKCVHLSPNRFPRSAVLQQTMHCRRFRAAQSLESICLVTKRGKANYRRSRSTV